MGDPVKAGQHAKKRSADFRGKLAEIRTRLNAPVPDPVPAAFRKAYEARKAAALQDLDVLGKLLDSYEAVAGDFLNVVK